MADIVQVEELALKRRPVYLHNREKASPDMLTIFQYLVRTGIANTITLVIKVKKIIQRDFSKAKEAM